jgi:putative ABC transport system permease protein
LKDAPQTIFTAVRVDPNRISAIQNRIVEKFPNVSVIDLTAVIDTFARTTKKLSNVLRFFTLFSILAGLLIIISSVFATRFARTREAVYYQVLGARSTFVIKVFGLENFFLGLVSALIALALSQCASWIITSQVFDIAYKPYIAASIILILIMGLIVLVFGLLPSLSVLKQKPVTFLREQTGE